MSAFAPKSPASRALAWAALALAFWLSVTQQPPPPPPSDWLRPDLIAHVAMHFGVAFLAAWAWGARAAWLAAPMLALYLEIAQLAAPGRQFDVADLAANALGALIGLIAAAHAARWNARAIMDASALPPEATTTTASPSSDPRR